jgi:hypothetical protein
MILKITISLTYHWACLCHLMQSFELNLKSPISRTNIKIHHEIKPQCSLLLDVLGRSSTNSLSCLS